MQKLGPYRILRTIAMGGMGEVYLAALEREGGFEKQVALKCVLPRLMTDPRFLEFFEREARLAAVLTHRNIVPVFDFGRDQGRAWLAMEYVHGVDVKAVYDHLEAPLPVGLALEIAVSCARALDYAHRARDARGRPLNIIHRDVSPQNILLSFEGDVKLADFGLAQATARESQEEGTLKGKFAYMSPEQAQGRAVDGRSDQFSLAIVLYELLSGCRAFYTEDGAEVILARVGQGTPLKPLGEVAEFLPPAIIQVVERALSRDRRDRFADAGRFADALGEAARQHGISIGQPEVGQWLRALFPSRAISQRGAEKTIESTAVAAEPINLIRAGETTAIAEVPANPAPSPKIGFEHTASAELDRPTPELMAPDGRAQDSEGTTAPPPRLMAPDGRTQDQEDTTAPPPPVEPENAPSLDGEDRGVSRFPWVISIAFLGLSVVIATGLMSDPSPVPGSDGPRDRTVSPSVTQIRSLDAGAPIPDAQGSPNPPDAKPAPDAGSSADMRPVPDVAPLKSVRKKQPALKRALKRQRGRTLRREAPRQAKASTKNPDVGAIARPKPVPDAAVAKPVPDAALDKPVPQPEAVEPAANKAAPPPLAGPRLRTRGGTAQIGGPSLRNGWFRLSETPMKGRVKSENGPLIQFRAVLKGGVPWVAFVSKPYGTLFLDGVDSGPTPRMSRPAKLGQTRVKVRDEAGNQTEFILQLAE